MNPVQPLPPLPAIEYAERSDPGRDPKKQVNEDACGRRETRLGHLCVVCDGMGGHAAGREAARLALATIFQVFDETPEGTPPDRVLRGAVEEASRRVYRTYRDAIRHPGSTVVAVLMHAHGTEVAHVGDSRAYLVKEKQIARLTRDHSIVQELVDCGMVPADQAAQHPVANRITRALGTAAEVEVDLRAHPVRHAPSDAFVLCSDGLSDLVEEQEILAIVGSEPAARAVNTLVDLANARGGHDNVTVVVLRAREAALEPAADAAPTLTMTRTTQPPTRPSTGPEAAVVEPPGAERRIAPTPASSVWRLDCEVGALGDGRVELVDKGSSIGLRLNGSGLRGGTVEPGDVVELGDVKFNIVAAGQLSRPQSLAVPKDRAPKKVGPPRAWRALNVAMLVLGAVAGAVVLYASCLRPRAAEPPVPDALAAAVSPDSPDQRVFDEAKRLRAAGNCEAAHSNLEMLSQRSPLRATQEFRDIENCWADDILARADGELDPGKKRAMLRRVAQSTSVDDVRRQTAADRLLSLDDITNAAAATKPLSLSPGPTADPDTTAMAPTPDNGRRVGPVGTDSSTPPEPPRGPWPFGSTAKFTAPPPKGDPDDKERALRPMTPATKKAYQAQLEQKVYSGRATDAEINLLIARCSELGDKPCLQQARAIKTQRDLMPLDRKQDVVVLGVH